MLEINGPAAIYTHIKATELGMPLDPEFLKQQALLTAIYMIARENNQELKWNEIVIRYCNCKTEELFAALKEFQGA